MLSLEHCRQILGKNAETLNDAQVIDIRDKLYGLAQLLTSKYVQEHLSGKNT